VLVAFEVAVPDILFEDRLQLLESLRGNKYIRVVDYVKCTGPEHLEKYIEGILKKNGEGVMLREPQSLYTVGRSKSMRKYKVSKFLNFKPTLEIFGC
jgi:DNA ligase-1